MGLFLFLPVWERSVHLLYLLYAIDFLKNVYFYTMSEKELKQFSETIKKYAKKLSKDKKASKAFLIKTGIITEKGNLTNPYKHLCIQQGQD